MAVLCSSSSLVLPSSSVKSSGGERRSPFLGFSLVAVSNPSVRVGISANRRRGFQVKCEVEEKSRSLVPANQRWMFEEDEADGPDIWNKTWYPKASDHVNTDKPWYVVDATDKILGRLASTIAVQIRGKNLASYTPSVDMGAFVIVVNAEKIAVSGKKRSQKLYRRHSGRPGGMKVETFSQLQQRIPERIIEHAVRGMLPKGRLGRALFNHLKVYKGPDHPHEAQKPMELPIRDKRVQKQS
ncbi:PREDICTED: 50S ribosomal protein L13, chloroplastic [Tarenaya hassleriana]|uniref:50S ribosomal protein L13, chloroplastic n=1 Tax=Tarenaya hassleriana TaxID=28532 RepID=UPI00053C214C|nr:PREDICTED: 50S ribosomal protein L13, chloroplastic [Tarenaya hassleriana]